MHIITERDSIKQAIQGFIRMYGNGTYGADRRGIKVGQELSKLDSNTCTTQEVNSLIDNDWTSNTCYECRGKFAEVICLGEEPDYGSNTTYLCKECLIKAYNLFIKED